MIDLRFVPRLQHQEFWVLTSNRQLTLSTFRIAVSSVIPLDSLPMRLRTDPAAPCAAPDFDDVPGARVFGQMTARGRSCA